MRALRILTDGLTEVIDTEADLESIQEHVGGFIEGLPLSVNVIAYINEEGKLKDLPLNQQATRFLRLEGVITGDTIKGDMLIFGMDVERGEETDLSETFINYYFNQYA